MSENEEKGFVFKDRRKIFSESEQQAEQPRPTPQEGPAKPEEEPRSSQEYSSPLPEVNFSTLIVSLSTEVLFHLGELPHPVSGEKKKDLPLAKHAIDTLALLQEKTKGNLTEEEQKLLEGMLYDLRMAFIRTK
jgi:hypothetical protein